MWSKMSLLGLSLSQELQELWMKAQPSFLKASIHTVRASPQFVEFEPWIEKLEQNFLFLFFEQIFVCLISFLKQWAIAYCLLFYIP